MHGKGVHRFADGSVYDGMFKEGRQHGRALYTTTSGTMLDGEYVNGKQQSVTARQKV